MAQATLRLFASPNAPARARAEVAALCRDVSVAAMDDALLLTSELVTNAVNHGEGIITLAVECDEHAIAVAVGDDSPDHGGVAAEDLTAEAGRGLMLVDAIARSWGVRPRTDGPGKTVWFSLEA